MLELSVVGSRLRSSSNVACLVVAAGMLLAACATQREPASAPGAAVRPKVLTVTELQSMAEEGTPVGVMFGKIDSSGTVYRLTTEQSANLRASGMPASLISYIEQGYQRAIQKNPALAKSDDQWHQLDGYWYGGLPYGWPRDWVVGAPRPGEMFR